MLRPLKEAVDLFPVNLPPVPTACPEQQDSRQCWKVHDGGGSWPPGRGRAWQGSVVSAQHLLHGYFPVSFPNKDSRKHRLTL